MTPRARRSKSRVRVSCGASSPLPDRLFRLSSAERASRGIHDSVDTRGLRCLRSCVRLRRSGGERDARRGRSGVGVAGRGRAERQRARAPGSRRGGFAPNRRYGRQPGRGATAAREGRSRPADHGSRPAGWQRHRADSQRGAAWAAYALPGPHGLRGRPVRLRGAGSRRARLPAEGREPGGAAPRRARADGRRLANEPVDRAQGVGTLPVAAASRDAAGEARTSRRASARCSS